MSDDSSNDQASEKETQKLEKPSYEGPDASTNELRADNLPDTQKSEAIEAGDGASEVSEADGTVELQAQDLEPIDPDAIQPLEEEDQPLEEQGGEDSESTQIMERDRIQQQVEQDQGRAADDTSEAGQPKTTQEMRPVEESTTAFEIPAELIDKTRENDAGGERPADGPDTEKMSALDGLNATSEFNADFDEWLDVGEDGQLHFVARVDNDGALIVPRGLLDDDLLPPGSVLVIDAEIIEPDD
mgnify:CR=1 FL=1